MIWPDNPTWKCLNCENSGGDDPAVEHEEDPSTPNNRGVLTRPLPGESKEEFKERVIAAFFGTPKPTEQDRDSTLAAEINWRRALLRSRFSFRGGRSSELGKGSHG